jgi:hypothetical protein
MAAWARAVGEGKTRGKTGGAVALLVPAGAHRGASSARSTGMPPRGGFLRGSARFCGSVEDFRWRW